MEMDSNMPSGESFCRQFLYGQRYFKDRFNKRCDVLVLPDTCGFWLPPAMRPCSSHAVGFSPQLPQIARLGGCTSFFTHKMNWNAM